MLNYSIFVIRTTYSVIYFVGYAHCILENVSQYYLKIAEIFMQLI